MFFTKPTQKTTVASVMATFQQTLDDLRSVEDIQVLEAERQKQIMAEAKLAASAAEWEAESAREIGAKLAAFITPGGVTTNVVNITNHIKASA